MSEAHLTDEAVATPVKVVPAAAVATPVGHSAGISRIVLAVVAVVALVALLMAFLLWQNVNGMREQLARQSADALAQAGEARTLARQASEVVRDAAGKIALNETRIAELGLQRAQLEDVLQTLSRSRDESMVVEIDSAVRLGLQQAQATGNIEPLLVALKFGEQRVARSAQPRLAPLQRAMVRDLDQLQSTAGGGIADSLHKLDDLMRLVDELPAVNAVVAPGGGNLLASEPLPPDAPWWQQVWMAVLQEARSLVRVGRVDRPEAVLLSQDQVFFLRENLKLKLLTVRLSLLSRQMSNARAELASVTTTLNRYFDPRSRRTQAAATLMQQLQAQVKDAPSLNIDNTLAALTAAAAGR